MATITTIQATDLITDSRTDINDNFANLNSDKIETSYLDTDTTLAADSDVKIPSQKAVKAYVDAGGNVNASETTKGIVEEATDAEVTAGTATGATGAKLFVTPAKLATRISTTERKIVASAAGASIANTTDKTNIFSVSIPAGSLGTSNLIRVRVYISYLRFNDQSGDLTITGEYGTTSVASVTIDPTGAGGTVFWGTIDFVLAANAATNAQRGNLFTVFDIDQSDPNKNYNTDGSYFLKVFATGTATEDSTAAKDLKVTAQFAAAHANNRIDWNIYSVELIA